MTKETKETKETKAKEPPRGNAPGRRKAPEGDGGGRSGEKDRRRHRRRTNTNKTANSSPSSTAPTRTCRTRARAASRPRWLARCPERFRLGSGTPRGGFGITKRDGTSLRTMCRAAGGARVGEQVRGERAAGSDVSWGALRFTTEHWRVAPRATHRGVVRVRVGTRRGGRGRGVERRCGGRGIESGGGRRRRRRREGVSVDAEERLLRLWQVGGRGGGWRRGFRAGWTRSWRGGNSARSDTFGNDPLSSEHEFDVACVELWTE